MVIHVTVLLINDLDTGLGPYSTKFRSPQTLDIIMISTFLFSCGKQQLSHVELVATAT